METVLESILPKSRILLCFFSGHKDSMQRIFLKKCFLFTVGSVSRLKRFTTESRNSLKDLRKPQMMPDQVALLRLRQKQRLLCCGFRRTGKAMGRMYQCWWRIFHEINGFPGSNITCFTFYIHLWPIYWLSHVCNVFNVDRRMMNWKGYARKW
jgi:hypothetical protein